MAERLSRMNMRGDSGSGQSEKKKIHVRKILLCAGIVLLLAAAVFAAYHISGAGQDYSGYEIVKTLDIKATGSVEILGYRDGLLKVTRDGAEAMDKNGGLLWNVAYDMKKPIVKVRENYAVVGDRNGRMFYIMDGSGSVNPVSTIYPIVEVEAAAQGIAAVWTNDGTDDHIYIYDIDGTMLLDIETKASKDGFPLDIALSPDGKKLVTSYVTLEGSKAQSWVTFYNFGSVGQSYVDKIVGSFSYDDDLVSYVEFLNDEYIAVCCGGKIDVYRMKEIPELHSEISTEREIMSVFTSDTTIGLVTEDAVIRGEYVIERYDCSGKRKSSFTYTGNYGGIRAMGNNVIIYDALWFGIYSGKGDVIFRSEADTGIDQIYPINDTNELFLIGNGRADHIKLVKGTDE